MENKQKYIQACVAKWNQWRESGNGPKKRDDALLIIKSELEAAGCHLQLAEIQSQARSIVRTDGSEEVNSGISLMVWDLTMNSGKLIDYSRDKNFFAGLLQQARNVILTATRVVFTYQAAAKLGGKVRDIRGTMPDQVYVPGVGIRPLDKLTRVQLTAYCDRLLAYNHAGLTRWKLMSNKIDARYVLRFLEKQRAMAIELFPEVGELLRRCRTPIQHQHRPRRRAVAHSPAAASAVAAGD